MTCARSSDRAPGTLCPEELLDRNLKLEYADMNDIPSSFRGRYDFCWSACALEHLGSIQHGVDFIRASVDMLRPGGVAVHTTEFNFSSNTETVDNWPTVLFRRQDLERIAELLRADGHEVLPLDFELGTQPADRYIDIPPYAWDEGPFGSPAAGTARIGGESREPPHLRLALDGFACTSYGLIVRVGS